jgi:hypothetical protein
MNVQVPAALSVAIAAYLFARLNFMAVQSPIPLRELSWLDLLVHAGATLLIFTCLVSLTIQWLR